MEGIPHEMVKCIVDLCDNNSKIALALSAKWLGPFIDTIIIGDAEVDLIKNKLINPVNLTYTGKSNVSLSDMTRLQKLVAIYDCGIDQNSIAGLNLTELIACHNRKIRNVSWMSNLRVLNASFDCGIDQSGIAGLNLIELYVLNNDKIWDVSWMTNLRVLEPPVLPDQYIDGISSLGLTELIASGSITAINGNVLSPNLQILDAVMNNRLIRQQVIDVNLSDLNNWNNYIHRRTNVQVPDNVDNCSMFQYCIAGLNYMFATITDHNL